jgi:hypothetical protein
MANPKIQLTNLIPKGKFQPLEVFIETILASNKKRAVSESYH